MMRKSLLWILIALALLLLTLLIYFFAGPKEQGTFSEDSDQHVTLHAGLPSYVAALNPPTTKDGERQESNNERVPAASNDDKSFPNFLPDVAYGDTTELGDLKYSENNKFQDANVLDAKISYPDQYGVYIKIFLLDLRPGEMQILAQEKWRKNASSGDLTYQGSSYFTGNQLLVTLAANADPALAKKLLLEQGYQILHFDAVTSMFKISFLPKSANDYQIQADKLLQYPSLVQKAFPDLLIVYTPPKMVGQGLGQ